MPVISFFLMVSLCASFAYFQVRQNMDKITDEFFLNTEDFFFDNENIAEAISSAYTNLLNMKSDMNESNTVLLKMATNKIYKIHKKTDGYHSLGKRYVISTDTKQLIGFNRAYDFKKETELYPSFKSILINKLPLYIERKLAKSVVDKGLTSTQIYLDPVTGKKTYSLLSFIYDFTNNQVAGVLFYDRDASEFISNFAKNIPNNNYDYSIHDNYDGSEICIKGSCNTDDITSDIRYSYRYTFRVSESYLGAFLMNPLLLDSFILIFFMISIVYVLYIKKLYKTERAALTDQLTGSFNRNVLDLLSEAEISVCHIAIFDCNKFKQINDTYGHHAGDLALIHVSGTLRRSVRIEDYVIRLGGDEFCIIIFSYDYENAKNIAARAAFEVNNSSFTVNGNKLSIEVSHGVSSLLTGLDHGLREADSAMYRNKNIREEHR
ncbi:GGDEF domain-containing protein (plasmid) [Enterobacter huaxiensis]|nr:GGDEF domain-containing protein [Enterobacter huaxiensis]